MTCAYQVLYEKRWRFVENGLALVQDLERMWEVWLLIRQANLPAWRVSLTQTVGFLCR